MSTSLYKKLFRKSLEPIQKIGNPFLLGKKIKPSDSWGDTTKKTMGPVSSLLGIKQKQSTDVAARMWQRGLIWDGNTIGWDKDNYLKNTLKSIGLDLGTMEKEIIDREEELEQIILKNENDLRETGHWGVPLFGFKNEPFFGQDRIDLLLWRLKQHGLKEK